MVVPELDPGGLSLILTTPSLLFLEDMTISGGREMERVERTDNGKTGLT